MIKLPIRKSLSLFWNIGFFLAFIFFFQFLTGILLVFYYSNDVSSSFFSVQYIMYEVNFGWVLRFFHFNGASLFFFFLFLHIFKGLFYFSYRLQEVWFIGLIIFLVVMIEAFMGYVLVWAQISFWACVVITRLFTVIPVFGFKLVFWIWSGFSVSGSTLKFFFVLHFLIPWILIIFIYLHLFFLHLYGSTSSIVYCGGLFKVNFFSFYWLKDLYILFGVLIFFFFLFLNPFILGDPEMFLEADFLSSPVHIVPEWYFLFAYAILRSIPNKIFGVFLLLIRILVFFFFLLVNNYFTLLNLFNKFFVFYFIFFSIFLSWLGQCLVEVPFVILGLVFSFFYFFFIFLIFLNYISRMLLFK